MGHVMSEKTLKGCILKSLKNHPKNVLLEDDHCSWTGEQLNDHLQRVCAHLEKHTAPRSRVGICFHNSAPQALSILATILSDRVPVLINSVDLLEQKIDWVRHAKLNFVIAAKDLSSLILVPHLYLTEEAHVGVANGTSTLGGELNQILYTPPSGTGCILFTSGSTGEPKEVYVPEKGMVSTIVALIEKFQLNQKTVSSILLPVCHSMALNTQFLPTFIVGGKCRFYNLRLSMNKVFRRFSEDRTTFVSLIGEIVRTCWEERRLKNLPPCEEVEHVQLAGGLISPKHIEMTREIFPRALIHKGYGLTEAIRVTMVSSGDDNFSNTAVGRPLPFLDVEIRNDQQQKMPPLQYGEIYVRGDSVMLGMRPLSASSAQWIERGSFLATGDLGMIDQEGTLHVSGRLDSLFKVNGRRVSGVEIEKVALEVYDKFRFAKAILVEDERRDRLQIVLFIELDRTCWRDSLPFLPSEVQFQLANQLKQLNVPPKEIFFTRNIPRTSNGKLNLPQLREIWRNRSVRPVEKTTGINLRLFSVLDEVFL